MNNKETGVSKGATVDIEDIRLREIQMFLELVKIKSVREFARQRNMPPGQVSKWIQSLERKIGFPLIERSAYGVQPTSQALEYLPYFEKVQGLHEKLQGQIPQNENIKHFSFASSSFFSTHLIPYIMEDLVKSKDIQMKIIDLAPTQFIPVALRGAFDFCVHSQPLDWPRTWTTHEVGNITWHIYARKNHPTHKNSQLKEVLKHPFVMPVYWTPEGARNGDDQCPIPAAKRKRGHETATAASALEIIKVTNQIAFLPEIIARHSVDQGTVAPLKIPSWKPIHKPVFLSVKNTVVKQSEFEWLISVFEEKLATLPK